MKKVRRVSVAEVAPRPKPVAAASTPLEASMLPVLETLCGTLQQVQNLAKEHAARLNSYAEQCARLMGVDPKTHDLNLDAKAFVRKGTPTPVAEVPASTE